MNVPKPKIFRPRVLFPALLREALFQVVGRDGVEIAVIIVAAQPHSGALAAVAFKRRSVLASIERSSMDSLCIFNSFFALSSSRVVRVIYIVNRS